MGERYNATVYSTGNAYTSTAPKTERAGWWARLKHAWRCGGGWYEYDPDTYVGSCGFCGFRYSWPARPHPEDGRSQP